MNRRFPHCVIPCEFMTCSVERFRGYVQYKYCWRTERRRPMATALKIHVVEVAPACLGLKMFNHGLRSHGTTDATHKRA